ncbi:putative oxidoreductase [Streptomyces sp. 769]|nr:putative oxidoreductase [Streptomyces sp. 769]
MVETALCIIRQVGVRSGRTLLASGASGGVGSSVRPLGHVGAALDLAGSGVIREPVELGGDPQRTPPSPVAVRRTSAPGSPAKDPMHPPVTIIGAGLRRADRGGHLALRANGNLGFRNAPSRCKGRVVAAYRTLDGSLGLVQLVSVNGHAFSSSPTEGPDT